MQGKFTVKCANPECGLTTTVTIENHNGHVSIRDVMLALTQTNFAQDEGIKLVDSGQINGKCLGGSVHPVCRALIWECSQPDVQEVESKL